MTTPAYTSPVPDISIETAVTPVVAIEGTGRWQAAAAGRRLAALGANPKLIEVALDVAGVAFSVLAFAHTPVSAEFLFHVVFVVLVLHAFLFGLRGTLIRIGMALVPLLAYANASAFGWQEPALELTEWPLMFAIAIIVASMADKRARTSRLYASRFRQASERLLTVQEEERRRIAGELHDGVGQVLTALTLTLDAASTAPELATAIDRVRLARELSGTALAETRDLAHRMRPVRAEERGLVPALRDLASQSGFPVSVVADAETSDQRILGPTATVEVYRIVQEALANAARHSGAARAVVAVEHEEGWLSVTVSDEGVGFSREALSDIGIGLAGMEERARLLGGSLTITSQPGHGTRVAASVPADDQSGVG